ncbi:DUF6228 family protein [Vibrio sp. SCSIO 43136]|uniref:DUF6228 family protein n=1 Tax=Vibrio sp. SCSIO 43136 TaxID=2819101 RepID=UPI00207562D4|nr:DUF6228 family protein [Vibrio sp. SCSIO 43136]USD64111.1 hypothetical protein J4N39_08255 [Vibrio sp. SCSIO 43136]
MKITSENGIMAEFHSPELDSSGWLGHYSLSLSGVAMSSTIRVTNPPYGESPLDYFSMLARNWKGWVGEKNWVALEGEYSLSAKADTTGHITLRIKIWSGSCEPFWSSEVALIIEAGQLKAIEDGFKSFLHPNS